MAQIDGGIPTINSKNAKTEGFVLYNRKISPYLLRNELCSPSNRKISAYFTFDGHLLKGRTSPLKNTFIYRGCPKRVKELHFVLLRQRRKCSLTYLKCTLASHFRLTSSHYLRLTFDRGVHWTPGLRPPFWTRTNRILTGQISACKNGGNVFGWFKESFVPSTSANVERLFIFKAVEG
jgi:hypothetical protein